METDPWKTKPTDRFVLKWIKTHLSARITPNLVSWVWLKPWMITLFSSILGVFAGLIYALGLGWLAGCIAALAQVLDGVDGQFARLKGLQTRGGAFWDSVLDRYADGAMVIGLVTYLIRLPIRIPPGLLIFLGFLAIVGSSLVSYTSARAETLEIDLGKPTFASKGTRFTVMILCAWGSLLWPSLPLIGLLYLVLHPNLAVISRLIMALKEK